MAVRSREILEGTWERDAHLIKGVIVLFELWRVMFQEKSFVQFLGPVIVNPLTKLVLGPVLPPNFEIIIWVKLLEAHLFLCKEKRVLSIAVRGKFGQWLTLHNWSMGSSYLLPEERCPAK